jgi:putative endonuclease
MKQFTSRSQQIGKLGEDIAVHYLESKGFIIVERNFSKKTGEIDIVSRKDGVLHFIEVKSAVKHGEHYDPFENITPYKFHKLTRTIAWYLAEKRIARETSWVIDALAIHIVRETKHARINVLWNMTL